MSPLTIARLGFLWCFALSFSVLPGSAAQGAEIVLHSFCRHCGDGFFPMAGVIVNAKGTLYGTTFYGGGGTACRGGCGTVFKLTPSGKETVIHAFRGGNDGAEPVGGLTRDTDGNFYGTTQIGGNASCNGGFGCGAIFVVTKDGAERVVFGFSGSDGLYPRADLIADENGNLYGTTMLGGSKACNGSGCGAVFEFSPTGGETVRYAFQGGSDGDEPEGPVTLDKDGNLYGTTYYGGTGCYGQGCGTVFKLSQDGTKTVLHKFSGGSDGAGPSGALIIDKKGNLLGTTSADGAASGGTVYKLAPDGTLTVLYAFCSQAGCSDGTEPVSGVLPDSSGNLFGTTPFGGSAGWGTVFEIAPGGAETVIYAFGGGNDGGRPIAGLLADGQGDFFGTTYDGGSHHRGTVFEVTP
jgi:uncharacterized repeat protein (TIGR03803 family)